MNRKKRKLIAVIACVLVCLLAFAACAPATQINNNSVPFVAQSRLFK